MRRIACGILLLAAGVAQAVQLTVADAYPLKQHPTEIIVAEDDGTPLEGVAVYLTYRPNSMVERTDSLPPTDARGVTTWVPTDPGICTMKAFQDTLEIASQDVSVRFDSFPIQGIIVMVIAFVALFGGATFSLVMLFKPHKGTEDETVILVRGT